MLVAEILRETPLPVITVGEDAPLVEAARQLRGPDARLVVVCADDGRMRGVIGKTDIVDRISHCAGAGCTMPVRSVMTHDVGFCRPETSLRDVWTMMTSRGLKHVPVLDSADRPQGIVSARQVMEALLAEVEHEEELLREYVMCLGYR